MFFIYLFIYAKHLLNKQIEGLQYKGIHDKMLQQYTILDIPRLGWHWQFQFLFIV